jgi:hypothetical protein
VIITPTLGLVPYARDPVSELFDAGARKLLTRAYEHPGQWVGTRLADPSPRHLVWLAARGINPFGPDNQSAHGGQGVNARTRWARAFVRAVYYQHKWWSGTGKSGWRTEKRMVARHTGALEIEVGKAVRALGLIPAGRAVRIRLRPGGAKARRAVEALPDTRRIYTDQGAQGERYSDPELRDWS